MDIADAAALIIDWLRGVLLTVDDDVLDDVTVAGKVPPTRTSHGPLVVVRRSGGVLARPILDKPRLDFMCWHETEYKARALAAIVRGMVMFELSGEVLDSHTVYQPVEFSGPSLYPDPAGSDIPIVMFSAEIPVRIGG